MFTYHQQTVINDDDGHLIVSAVAGSGKTTTLIGRIVRLIQSGVSPSRILVLMFGKAVSVDFSARMQVAGAQYGVKCPHVVTFHAFGQKLITALVERGELPRARLLTKDFEVGKLVRAAIDEMNANLAEPDQVEATPEGVRNFVEMIESIKSTSSAAEVAAYLASPTQDSDLARFKRSFLDGFTRFEHLRKESGCRTFSDLIFDPVTAIRENDAIANYVANRYDHILVDEFQDINAAQWDMLVAIAGTRARITVVGDEDQAIFSWRGASSRFIGEMQKKFSNVRVCVLPHTFRFGHRISMAANHVIANNSGRMDKMVLSAPGTPDTRVGVVMHELDSGSPAAHRVRQWLAAGRTPVDIAVLVREYSHGMSVEAAFLQNNIPYRILGAEPFFNRPEVLSLRGCLQLATGGLSNLDPLKLKPVINAMLRVPGLYLKNEQIEYLSDNATIDPSNFVSLCKDYERRMSAVPGANFRLKALRSSIAAWEECVKAPKGVKASVFLENVVRKLGLYEYFNRTSVADGMNERERMVRGLIRSALNDSHTVVSFAAMLDDLAGRYEATGNDDCVLITSIHRAKGLEWPCVILPELSEGNFPSLSPKEKPTDATISYERNLFYVGMTRAKENLLLICPKDPLLQKWSNAGSVTPPPLESIVASRFLFEGNFAACSVAGKAVYENAASPGGGPVISRYLAAAK